MALWRPFIRGLRALFDGRADRELADEVAHFLAAAVDDLVDRGESPDEARRTVRRPLGSSSRVRETVRESGWEHGVDTLAGRAPLCRDVV